MWRHFPIALWREVGDYIVTRADNFPAQPEDQMVIHSSDLVPSNAKSVAPFTTRFGETWYAVMAYGETLSVHPTEKEARDEIAGVKPAPAVCLAFGY